MTVGANPAFWPRPEARPHEQLALQVGLKKMGRRERVELSTQGLQDPRSTGELPPP